MANGSPGRNAAIELPALNRIVRADADGRFRLTGIPVGGHAVFATFDADADGIAEEGAVRTLLMPRDQAGQPVGLDIGDVRLEPTGTLTGFTFDNLGVAVGDATVALWRNIEVEPDGGGPAVLIDLGVERTVQTDPDGSFTLPGLIPGDALMSGFDFRRRDSHSGRHPILGRHSRRRNPPS